MDSRNPDILAARDGVEEGEVIIRSPKASYTYLSNPKEEKKKFYITAQKSPRFYRFVGELPMTASGKLQHYRVKEMALADQKTGHLKLAMKKD